MALIYSLISSGNDKILCEANFQSGNYPQLIQRVLKEKNPQNVKVIYQISGYAVHVYNDGGITYLVLSDTNFSKRSALAYLMDIKNAFTEKYTPKQIKESFAYSLQTQFGEYMKSKMLFFSESKDNLQQLIGKVDETQQIMIENVEKILERGEKIEILVKKTQDMRAESSNLKSRAEQLKSKKRCENIRTKLVVSMICILILYFILVIACGGFNLPCFWWSRMQLVEKTSL